MRYNLGSLDWMDVSLCLCLVDGWTTGMFQTLHRTKYGTGERFQSHCHSQTNKAFTLRITDYGLRITDYIKDKRIYQLQLIRAIKISLHTFLSIH